MESFSIQPLEKSTHHDLLSPLATMGIQTSNQDKRTVLQNEAMFDVHLTNQCSNHDMEVP